MQKVLALFALVIFFALTAMGQEIPVQEKPKPDTASSAGSKKKKKPQEPPPKYEVGGGFTYRSFYPPSAQRFGTNGWNGEFAYNYNRWLSLAADGTGTYKDQGVNGKTSIYTLMGGPRIYIFGHRHRLVPYGQFLFGFGHEIFSIPFTGGFPAATRTSTAFAFAGGAGVDIRLTKHWNLRAIEFDYERTHFSDIAFFTAGNSESNYRISAGFVFHWGEKKK